LDNFDCFFSSFFSSCSASSSSSAYEVDTINQSRGVAVNDYMTATWVGSSAPHHQDEEQEWVPIAQLWKPMSLVNHDDHHHCINRMRI
jgi:hypothetical protein